MWCMEQPASYRAARRRAKMSYERVFKVAVEHYQIACCSCLDSAPFGESLEEARVKAQAEGWRQSINSGAWLCDPCIQTFRVEVT